MEHEKIENYAGKKNTREVCSLNPSGYYEQRDNFTQLETGCLGSTDFFICRDSPIMQYDLSAFGIFP